MLPNGDVLIAGGMGDDGLVQSTLSMRDSSTHAVVKLASKLQSPRAWHSATVLPDGGVLILGGIGRDGNVVTVVELFDPQSQTVATLAAGAPTPRAFHTATVLTDGSVLVAGGVSQNGVALKSLELWDPRHKSGTVLPAHLSETRRNHSATLLPDGRVLFWGGKGAETTSPADEIFDPQNQTIAQFTDPTSLGISASGIAEVKASSPEDGAQNIPVDALISMRFSKPVLMSSVNGRTVSLKGPGGAVAANVVAAENGMLAFVTSSDPLLPGTSYAVTLSGAEDNSGNSVAFFEFVFSTSGEANSFFRHRARPPPASAIVKCGIPPQIGKRIASLLRLNPFPTCVHRKA